VHDRRAETVPPLCGTSRRPAARAWAELRTQTQLSVSLQWDWDCIQDALPGAARYSPPANAASQCCSCDASSVAGGRDLALARLRIADPPHCWLDTLPSASGCSSGTRTLCAARHRLGIAHASERQFVALPGAMQPDTTPITRWW
jgi:hypothetical protein